MPETPLFKAAFPYQNDVLALPVTDLDAASRWYSSAFGLKEVEANGISIGNRRVDERNGQKLQVFFVVAPDGLCFDFHQPL